MDYSIKLHKYLDGFCGNGGTDYAYVPYNIVERRWK